MTIQFKDAAGFHETEDGSGIFEGYASVFGNVDSYGDKVSRARLVSRWLSRSRTTAQVSPVIGLTAWTTRNLS